MDTPASQSEGGYSSLEVPSCQMILVSVEWVKNYPAQLISTFFLHKGSAGLLNLPLTARRGTLRSEMPCLVLNLGLRSIISYAHESSVYPCTVLSGSDSSSGKDPQPSPEMLFLSTDTHSAL